MSTENEASCPDCRKSIDLGTSPRVGLRLSCLNCHAYLEIINLKPAEVDWAFSECGLNWVSQLGAWEL